jgi:hypothetical protein
MIRKHVRKNGEVINSSDEYQKSKITFIEYSSDIWDRIYVCIFNLDINTYQLLIDDGTTSEEIIIHNELQLIEIDNIIISYLTLKQQTEVLHSFLSFYKLKFE